MTVGRSVLGFEAGVPSRWKGVLQRGGSVHGAWDADPGMCLAGAEGWKLPRQSASSCWKTEADEDLMSTGDGDTKVTPAQVGQCFKTQADSSLCPFILPGL